MIYSPPFHKIPSLMTIHAIINIGKMLNYFLTKVGVSNKIISRDILNGENLDYEKYLRLQYGEYSQVHENETPCNSKKAITQGAICIGPCGN